MWPLIPIAVGLASLLFARCGGNPKPKLVEEKKSESVEKSPEQPVPEPVRSEGGLSVKISDVPSKHQKSLRRVDNQNDANGYIEGAEVGEAAELLSGKTVADAQAEAVLKRILGIEDISGKAGSISPLSISASWGKSGIKGRIDKSQGKIIIEGNLASDCELFVANFGNVLIPQGKKHLVFDLNYESRAGAWGGACMFELSVNGAPVKPVNLDTQNDGMILRAPSYPFAAKFTLPKGDESLRSITVKTFAGEKILIEISNLRFE